MTFCMKISIKLSYKLIPLILVCMVRPAQITQINKFAKSLQYLKIEVRNEVDFFTMRNTVFYKLILSFLMVVARHT